MSAFNLSFGNDKHKVITETQTSNYSDSKKKKKKKTSVSKSPAKKQTNEDLKHKEEESVTIVTSIPNSPTKQAPKQIGKKRVQSFNKEEELESPTKVQKTGPNPDVTYFRAVQSFSVYQKHHYLDLVLKAKLEMMDDYAEYIRQLRVLEFDFLRFKLQIMKAQSQLNSHKRWSDTFTVYHGSTEERRHLINQTIHQYSNS